MQVSRRTLIVGLAALPLAACTAGVEVGSELDEGGFGNPTANNILVQSGQLPYVIDLAERFALYVPTTVTFDFNSTYLDGPARAILLRQADWIGQFPEAMFRVYGHTDAVGSAAANRRLGMRRARTVVAFLIRNGVPRNRLQAVVSEGETQPLIQTTERERQNRRTVTEVSGFWQQSPTIINGQYGQVIQREFIESATQRPIVD